MTRGVLLLLLMSLGALGRPLSGSAVLQTTAERRQLAEDLNLVLSLDASSGDLSGDATWPSADPSVSVKLTNAGYDAAYEGSVSFTPPAASGDVGTYGQSSELLAVGDAAWGSEFTALVWYKGAQPAGSNAVLLQVAYTDETSGDLKPSATWRVGGFSDDTQGSRPLSGFRAQPTWGALEDCWQQLAVVKSGPELTFYRNGEEAGTAAASFVVPDYGATTIGLGVEIASLAEPGSNGTAPTVNPAALDADLGWLSGSIATLAVYSRALAAEDIAAAYTASATRFAEGACKADAAAPAPSPAEPPAPAEPNQPDNTTEPAENSPAPVDATPSDNATTPGSPDTTTQSPEPASPAPVDPTASPAPVDPTASPAPVDPTASPAPVDPTASPSPAVPIPSPAVPSPNPVPSPVPVPQPPAKSNSTFDNSTAEVEGSGTQGRVANTLTITGDEELADFENDAQKQSELRRAIVNSLNLEDDEFGEDNVEIRVVKKERRRRKEVTVEVYEWVVVCDYVLLPTPKAPVEVLVKAEINVYLFIRVQQPVMPWWKGDKASVCISDKEGECRPQTPPIPPPVKEESCSANVCFLLDGSKSLINVDAWNDVVASARSIMYSIADPAAVFDVFWFSNDVERIGKQVTGAEVAADNKFIKEVMNTVPNAHGTFMAQAIQTCQDVLLEETEGPSKTIVLITDGKPTDQPDALEAAAEARKRGIKMVTVGAGDIDYDILKQLSSGPSYVFANFQLDASGLLKVADLASRGVCRELD